MGNIFQRFRKCFRRSSPPAVTRTPHDEGSSIIPSSPLPIPTKLSSPAVGASHDDEGSSLPLSSPRPPCIDMASSPPTVTSTASSSSLSIDSLKLRIQEVDHADQIEPLISFIDYQLQRIKGSSQEASSSSVLTAVASTTSLAAQFIDSISTEAASLANTDIAKEMGRLALEGLKKVGEAHWIFLGLSVVASALERGVTMRSNIPDCLELLQTIVRLAKDLKRFNEAMPDERERLCGAVQTIVEGAIMCSDYINKGRLSRYWSATTIKDQLEKTNQSLNDIKIDLIFPLQRQNLKNTTEILQNTERLARKATKRFEESPLRLLQFEPVGIEEKVAEVTELLDMEGTELVRAIVLCGFGGLGKSTLAASVIKNLYQNYPQTCAGFKFCRVIINEKSIDETSHVMQLQKHIIHSFGGGKMDFGSPQDGQLCLQDVMENKSCFLFIDNVAQKKYVQQLLPEDLKWFNKSIMSADNLGKSKTKLRILITSREKNLISKSGISYEEFDVNSFSKEKARSFLRKTILETDGIQCDSEEEALINDVADACRGIPILLSVFGKQLKDDRKLGSYRDAQKALLEGNPDGFAKEENLSKQLFFVYSKLEKEDQEAFLDICKYFYGWEWELVCNILDEATVKILQSKMLINKSESDTVIVHDILRIMGEKEAEETRISDYNKLSEIVEDGKESLENVKGISLVNNGSLITIETSFLDATHKSLRVLMIGDWVKINGLPCKRTFQNLRYLNVGDAIDFPFADISKLRRLKAFFNGSKHGMNLHQLPPSLKIISHHLQDPCALSFETLPLRKLPFLQSFIVETKKLVKLPEEFGFPASLVDLQLNCCGKLPKEISNLAALERLILDKCDMKCLPQGMGELKKLKHLSMQNCTKLAFLPKEVGLLSSMTCLRLCGCTLLQNLPEDLGNMSALEELNMRDCENLRDLPQGIGDLSSLQKLDLSGCISLKTLPQSFADLRIKSLTLQSLLSLESLPSCFGNMPCLSYLKLISCNSLSTLPNSFVKLKCLKTLKIIDCSNIVALPGDFGSLSLLSKMTLRICPKLQELPHGFQALPALKRLHLHDCSSLVSLPSGFGELSCLEMLILKGLSISSLPDGFWKLKRLDTLIIQFCLKLETLSDDFETLPSLTTVMFCECYKLDGAAMESISKLQYCWYVEIGKSAKLVERWKEMREEDNSPLVVITEKDTGKDDMGREEWKRAARVGLLRGKCVEWDNAAQQLIERSTSTLLEEEETSVAVICLPLHMEFHHHLLCRLVGAAMEKAKTASKSGRLRLVYVKRVEEKGETTKQEKEEEEECFRQILKLAPIGSCAIAASTDLRRHRLITYLFFDHWGYGADNKLACCMANVVVEDKQHKFGDFVYIFGEDDISGEAIQSSESSDEEDKISNRIGDFIESICSGKSPNESKLTDFIQILKENNTDHLIDSRQNQVVLDQLKGKVVCILISDLNMPEYIKLEQIYKELKSKGHDFEMIWVPLLKNESYGLGTCTRAIQKMSWTVLPIPNMVKVERKNPVCIIFDEEGNIANQDALSAMISWGVEAFPFTKSKVNEIASIMHSESSLSFLFKILNQGNKGVIENKLIFLYAEPPSPKLKMKFSLEKLEQIHNNVHIIYVGFLFVEECDVAIFKEVYEDAIQEMHWQTLSFEDMVIFWHHCKYLMEEAGEKLNSVIEETLKRLVKHLYIEKRWLVLLDSDGLVTGSGYEVLKKMCKPNDEKIEKVDPVMKMEVMVSLQQGKCTKFLREFFKDEICHPSHQHPLLLQENQTDAYYCCNHYNCNVCGLRRFVTWEQQRLYRCDQCRWDVCINCWELFSQENINSLILTKD